MSSEYQVTSWPDTRNRWNKDYGNTLSEGAITIAAFAHRPSRSLVSTEAASGVDFSARAFEVDLDVETMFVATKAVSLRRTKIYFIDAGAEIDAPCLGDDIAAFEDRDFRLAFAVTVELNAHFPGSNPLAFDHRVRGHIQILDL
jgi:hypothetical protein